MTTPTIVCRCGAVNYPLQDKLPCTTELCHCNPCRQTSGNLFEGFVQLKESKPSTDVQSKCTAYASSKTHLRWFCSTCGTKLFISGRKDDGTPIGSWSCLGGAIDPPTSAGDSMANVLDVETHEWLTDTGGDGGMAPLMTKLGDREIACYDTDRESHRYTSTELEFMVKASASIPAPAKGDTLRAECRCGGVSLRIKPANHADENIPRLEEYIPKDASGARINDRYYACTCTCRDCRLHTGVSLTTWVYIPPTQIINPHTNERVAQHRDASDNPASNRGLKLMYYWSSPGVCRAFCSVCGASVFYTFDDRPEIINIGPGLLRPDKSGIMAREWVAWDWGETSFAEEATDRDITEAWRALSSHRASKW